ncbi:hypothetical protein F2P81_006553 [Scophthalmus maximus]|uniref:Uncharacterized protein n=1 Tax=Scophthalmus maximus TaxID=52904 RepID=A0A6A4T679_SCOMX|nr:hypothetical protein F2P81_006553 [Scophthalmus maximus]
MMMKTGFTNYGLAILQSKLLKKAASMLAAEIEDKKHEKERVVNECFPPLKLSGLAVQELQDLCKELHRKIDVVDEARYEVEVKVARNNQETLNGKIVDLKGVKRPSLKRVKKTTDDMLGAFTDTTKHMKADFKVNLKTVKKEEDKTKLLKLACVMLEKDKEEKKLERETTLSERVPSLQLSGLSVQDLQALCKDLHHKIDTVDEERYDIDAKVEKNNKEIENLSQKVFELKGKMKRPALKRVKISADAMLGALLGSKVKESVDFKANLKTVKKEEEKKEEVTDWRKNVESMSGMEGRKKLFDAGQ